MVFKLQSFLLIQNFFRFEISLTLKFIRQRVLSQQKCRDFHGVALPLTAILAALVGLDVGLLQQLDVFRRCRWFPRDSLFRNDFVCSPEFSAANCTLAFACHDLKFTKFVVFVSQRCGGPQIKMRNNFAVQKTRARRVPEVF